MKANPDTPEPKPEDLAVPFFTDYSNGPSGHVPRRRRAKAPDGKTEKQIEPVKEGSDIQAAFFDMWLRSTRTPTSSTCRPTW